MSLKFFITISLMLHILMLNAIWQRPPKIKNSKVKLRLQTNKTTSEKNLNQKKTNTIQTKENAKKQSSKTASYYENLIAFVQSKATYPKSALSLRQEGSIVINITVLKNGNFKVVKLLKKSEFNSLNATTLKLIKNLQSYKRLPIEYGSEKEFSVPINYILN